MSDKDGKRSLEELLSGTELPLRAEDPPEFVVRARQRAADTGTQVDAVLGEIGFEALRDADYPGPTCLQPYELELVGGGRSLASVRQAHVRECVPCRRLLDSAQRRTAHVPPLSSQRQEPSTVREATLASKRRRSRWRAAPLLPAAGLAAAVLLAIALNFLLVRQPGTDQTAPELATNPSPVPVPNTQPPTSILPPTATNGTQAGLRAASVAVLPVTGARSLGYVEDGLSEALAQRLSRIGDLRVIAPSSSTAIALVAQDGSQLAPGATTRAHSAGVDALLATHVDTLEGNRLRVVTEVVDTARGVQWSKDYVTDVTKLAKFNAKVAEDVSGALRPRLSVKALADTGVTKVDTHDDKGYLDYFQGRVALAQRDQPGLEMAIGFFEKALKRDPDFALAHAGLADAYALQGLYVKPRPVTESQHLAERAARRALDLDPSLAEARTAFGLVSLWRRDLDEADRNFKLALDKSPSYVQAHRWYANLLMAREDFAAAQPHIERVVALDPLSRSTRVWESITLCLRSRPDDAQKVLRPLLQPQSPLVVDGPEWQVRFSLGQALVQGGKLAEGIGELEKAKSVNTNEMTLAALGYAYAKANKRSEALAIVRQLAADPSNSDVLLAGIYGALGDKEQAFKALDKAYAAFDMDLLFLRIDSTFDDLRSDPRFERLVMKMGLRSPAGSTRTQTFDN